MGYPDPAKWRNRSSVVNGPVFNDSSAGVSQ